MPRTASVVPVEDPSKNARDPRLIIFDCDGTLIDSQHMIVGAMNRAFTDNGLIPPTPEQTRSIIGLSLEEAFRALGENCQIEGAESCLPRLVEAYKDAFVTLRQEKVFSEPMYEGAREALERFNGRDHVILGVATGKSRLGLRKVLEREALTSFFMTLQTADDAPSKPHPGMLHRAMNQTGIAPHHTVMIGDTCYDMEMAVNAGVHAVGVAWGYHSSEVLHEAGACYVAEDFRQLWHWLEEEVGA